MSAVIRELSSSQNFKKDFYINTTNVGFWKNALIQNKQKRINIPNIILCFVFQMSLMKRLLLVHPLCYCTICFITSHSSNDKSGRLDSERELLSLLGCQLGLTDRASHTLHKATSGCYSKLNCSQQITQWTCKESPMIIQMLQQGTQ